MSSTKTAKTPVERLRQKLFEQIVKQTEQNNKHQQELINLVIENQRIRAENAMREVSAHGGGGGGGSGKAGLLLGLGAAGLGGYYLGRKLNKGKKKT